MKKILLFAVLIITSASLKLNAQALPAAYTQTNIITGLHYCVDWDWAPDGRYFITEKGHGNTVTEAKVLVYSAAGVLLGTFCDLSDSTNSNFERGLLGIAIDPNFATNHYVYTYYVHKFGTANQIRILRWTENANVGTNSTIILKIDLNLLSFTPAGNHFGGIIRFRPSDPTHIYFGIGDLAHNQTDTTLGANLAQLKTYPFGKMLRIGSDGSIPTDNPFYDDGNPATGNDDRIWSYGHRNMFGFCFSTVSDSMYEAENGLNTWDEFNIIHKGGNYGWNFCEGDYYNSSTTTLCPHPSTILPMTEWGAPVPSATGCVYYTGNAMPEFDNHIIVGDNNNGILHDLTLGNPPAYDVVTNNVNFAQVAAGLTTVREGTDGCIYAMNGGYTTTGSIFKICHLGVGISGNEQINNTMSQNYPNPTTGKTQIDYTIAQNAAVSIDLFDVTGRKIKTILNENTVQAGKHTVEIDDLNGCANGSYFYKMNVKQNGKSIYSETKRLILVH